MNGGRDRILFVNPDNLSRADGKEVAGKSRDRKNLTVQLSYDEGKSWSIKRVGRQAAPAIRIWLYCPIATSCAGTKKALPILSPRNRLILAKFNLQWLTDGKDKSPIKNAKDITNQTTLTRHRRRYVGTAPLEYADDL